MSNYPHSEEEYERIVQYAYRHGSEYDVVQDVIIGDLFSWTDGVFGISVSADVEPVKLRSLDEKVGFLDWLMAEYEVTDDQIEEAVRESLKDKDDMIDLYHKPMHGLIGSMLGSMLLVISPTKEE